VRTYVCECAVSSTSTLTQSRIHTRTHVVPCIHPNEHVQSAARSGTRQSDSVPAHIHTQPLTYPPSHTHTHMYIYICVCVYIYMRTDAYIRTHTTTVTRIHTHTHIYIYTVCTYCFFCYTDEQLGQGRDKVIQYLADNPETAKTIEERVRAILAGAEKEDGGGNK